MNSLFKHTWRFEWKKPPLSLNDRMHHMAKAKITAAIRADMHARARTVPEMERCEVFLVWFVTDKRRRDDENPVPTLKALCDGLIDAEVVEDDTSVYMIKRMPSIVYIPKSQDVAHFEFTLRELAS